MIKIENKEKCCGCTACYSICPKQCIVMKVDIEGFMYPSVDETKCIDCGMCEKICPILHQPPANKELSAVAVQNKHDDTLFHSAAGGAFSAIAEVTIKNAGIVYGAAYDRNMVVRHMSAETREDLKIFRSSKYVQSYMGEVFHEVEKDLQNGREVCFSGTPCQVAGLKAFLKNDYKNLITVDLVCKGVGSPKVLKQYVSSQEKIHNSKIIGMNFKRKTYGYHSSTMSVDFENNTSYSCGGITDPMMRSFRADVCLRPSCSECQFKGSDRASDITIFDCWHYKELTGKKDNDKGHTNVLIHSKKGKNRINQCVDLLEIEEISAEKSIELDGIMVNGRASVHPKRDEFMQIVEKEGLKAAIDTCIPITLSDRIKESSKKVLYKIGLLSFIKSIEVKRK